MYYAKGGWGAYNNHEDNFSYISSGTDNLGEGGGGGDQDHGKFNGGSGVVIIRFLKYQSYEETTSTDIIS